MDGEGLAGAGIGDVAGNDQGVARIVGPVWLLPRATGVSISTLVPELAVRPPLPKVSVLPPLAKSKGEISVTTMPAHRIAQDHGALTAGAGGGEVDGRSGARNQAGGGGAGGIGGPVAGARSVGNGPHVYVAAYGTGPNLGRGVAESAPAPLEWLNRRPGPSIRVARNGAGAVECQNHRRSRRSSRLRLPIAPQRFIELFDCRIAPPHRIFKLGRQQNAGGSLIFPAAGSANHPVQSPPLLAQGAEFLKSLRRISYAGRPA